MYSYKQGAGPGPGGGVSQLAHAAHEFLQLEGEHHVSFDLQLPRHEGQRGLQLPWNTRGNISVMCDT